MKKTVDSMRTKLHILQEPEVQVSKYRVPELRLSETTVKGRGGNWEKKSRKILYLHCFLCALILTAFERSPNSKAVRMHYGYGLELR